MKALTGFLGAAGESSLGDFSVNVSEPRGKVSEARILSKTSFGNILTTSSAERPDMALRKSCFWAMMRSLVQFGSYLVEVGS